MTNRIDILGVEVDDISPNAALESVLKLAKSRNKGNYVVTVNSEFVMMARRNKEFAKILEEASLAVADGWWVAFSKLILGGKEHDRVTGVDLVENVCRIGARKAIRIGFVGGFNNVAEMVYKRQKRAYPGLKAVIAEAGDPTIGQDSRLKADLDKAGRIDVLFVAFGMGRQEFWIDRIKKKVNVGVFVGVGGAFDYLANVKKRAPKLWQSIGLEWLWRLLHDPVRIWRMRVLPAFFVLVLVSFLKRSFNPLVSKNS